MALGVERNSKACGSRVMIYSSMTNGSVTMIHRIRVLAILSLSISIMLIGSIIPGSKILIFDFIPFESILFLYVLLVAYIIDRQAKISLRILKSIFPIFVILVVASMRTEEPLYAIEKLTAFTLIPAVSATIALRVGTRYGMKEVISSICIILFFLFIFALAYKLKFGFWDRTVKYFMNGPIVFGWLMGIGSVLSLLKFASGEGRRWGFLSAIFLLAVLWSLSKGPLIAVALTILLISFRYVSMRSVIALLIITPLVFYLLGDIFASAIEAETLGRLEAMYRLLNGEASQIDYGSMSIRQTMYVDTLSLILEHPFFGVGLANWKIAANESFFIYPHNITLEILSECGILLGGCMLAWILSMTLMSHENKYILIFLMICLQFSGDLTYARFLVFFLLLFKFCVMPPSLRVMDNNFSYSDYQRSNNS